MNACRIESLRLYEFRNYADTTVEFGPGLNVMGGRNAQGKTNLLEAVATLTLSRSPRAASSADLFRWGSTACLVEAHVHRLDGPADLGVRFTYDTATRHVGRSATVNGKPRPARSLLGICPVVLFWPDDLLLVKAGPEGRRRLLDVVLSQLDPRAMAELHRYRRALEQRNALMRQLRDGGGSLSALASFEAEFIDAGARVRVARARLVQDLLHWAVPALVQLGGDGEALGLNYVAGGAVFDPTTGDVDQARSAISTRLQARRAEEVARGISLVGPHRDDVEVLLAGRPARTAASQGQQRSIVLALKLAEVAHIRATADVSPVLILDDVLSELDETRRQSLLATVAESGIQVLVTTAEPAALHGLGGTEIHFFEVDAGSIRPVR